MQCNVLVFHVLLKYVKLFSGSICMPVRLYFSLPVRSVCLDICMSVCCTKIHLHIQFCLVRIWVFCICIFEYICTGVSKILWAHIFAYQELPRQRATCHAWHAKRG